MGQSAPPAGPAAVFSQRTIVHCSIHMTPSPVQRAPASSSPGGEGRRSIFSLALPPADAATSFQLKAPFSRSDSVAGVSFPGLMVERGTEAETRLVTRLLIVKQRVD